MPDLSETSQNLLANWRPPSRRHRIRWALYRILPFGLIWLLLGMIFLFTEYVATDGFTTGPEEAIRPNTSVLVFALASVFLLGCVVGYTELYVLRKRFASLKFWQAFVLKVLVYTLVFELIIIVFFLAAAIIEDWGQTDPLSPWQRLLDFSTSAAYWNTFLQLGASLVISLFYGEMADSYGSRSLVRLLKGYYHEPRQEERIFLFADMRSSTSLTESLGHAQYFALLRAYLADLSTAILDTGGEVYQYVGDEVIVSWEVRSDGSSAKAGLTCYLLMRQRLEERADWYQNQFGVKPEFRAALHAGPVTIGEVGLLKRDLTFTGDVLNATARMQSRAKDLGVDFLLSDRIREALDETFTRATIKMSTEVLRGQSKTTELYTLKDV